MGATSSPTQGNSFSLPLLKGNPKRFVRISPAFYGSEFTPAERARFCPVFEHTINRIPPQ